MSPPHPWISSSTCSEILVDNPFYFFYDVRENLLIFYEIVVQSLDKHI
jgi:hypothetical protein